jgi:hypothetical protein
MAGRTGEFADYSCCSGCIGPMETEQGEMIRPAGATECMQNFIDRFGGTWGQPR